MASLSNVNGRTLVPDLSGGLNALHNAFGTKQSRDAEVQQKADLEEQIRILTGQGFVEEQEQGPIIEGGIIADPKQKEAALIRLSAINPQIANSVRQTLERGDQQELLAMQKETEDSTRQALFIKRQPDFVKKRMALRTIAEQKAAKGENLDRILELSNLPEERLDLELERMLVQGTDLKTLTDDALKPAVPQTDIAKAKQDLDNGLITKEQFSLLTKPKSSAQTEIGKINADLANGKITQQQADKLLTQKLSDPNGVEAIKKELLQNKLKIQQEQELKKNDPEEQLKLEKLRQDIESGELKKKESEQQRKKAEQVKGDAARLVNELLEDEESIREVVGPFDQAFFNPTIFPGSLKAQTKINQLKAILTADNLDLMTGVLSESDLLVLERVAGGGLDIKGNDDAFIEELKRMKKSFDGGSSIKVGETTTKNGVKIKRIK